MKIRIDYEKCCWEDGKCTSCDCGSCKGCIEACGVGAITRGKKVKIDNEKCIKCGACVEACEHGALSLK